MSKSSGAVLIAAHGGLLYKSRTPHSRVDYQGSGGFVTYTRGWIQTCLTSVSASSVGVNQSGNSFPFSVMPTPDNKLRAFTITSGCSNGGRIKNGLRSSVTEWIDLGSSVRKLHKRKLINTVNQVVERMSE